MLRGLLGGVAPQAVAAPKLRRSAPAGARPPARKRRKPLQLHHLPPLMQKAAALRGEVDPPRAPPGRQHKPAYHDPHSGDAGSAAAGFLTATPQPVSRRRVWQQRLAPLTPAPSVNGKAVWQNL